MLSKSAPLDMTFDTGRRLVMTLIDQTIRIGVQVAALSSALYCYTQLLPEENMVLDEFVYDAESPLEVTDDGTLYKARRWKDCKGVFKLVLWESNTYDAERSREAAILQHTSGVPHVLQYITHCTMGPPEEGQLGSFQLITERLQGGSTLGSLLELPVTTSLVPVQRMHMTRQIIRGLLIALAGLHERGIAHGAVDLETVYVQSSKTEDGQRNYDTKLIDFSSAVEFDPDKRVLGGKLLDLTGKNVHFLAPEVLVRSLRGADSGYPVSEDAADVWSAGVLLLWVGVRQLPFQSADADMRDLIKQHKAWDTAVHQRKASHPLLNLLDAQPCDFAALVVRLLQVDPVRRICAADALKHSFFAE